MQTHFDRCSAVLLVIIGASLPGAVYHWGLGDTGMLAALAGIGALCVVLWRDLPDRTPVEEETQTPPSYTHETHRLPSLAPSVPTIRIAQDADLYAVNSADGRLVHVVLRGNSTDA